MIYDHEAIFDDATAVGDSQAIAATRISTNVYDAGASINLGAAQQRLKLLVMIFAKTGTTPTLAGTFVGDTTAALTGSPVTLASFSTLSDPTVPLILHFAIPSHTPRRFFGWSWTLGGSATPKFAVQSMFVLDDPNSYPL